jgi:hypothetical protein
MIASRDVACVDVYNIYLSSCNMCQADAEEKWRSIHEKESFFKGLGGLESTVDVVYPKEKDEVY